MKATKRKAKVAAVESGIAIGDGWTMQHGRWQDVLDSQAIRQWDALISDPPYSERTHASEAERSDGVDAAGLAPTYAAWTKADVDEFVDAFSPRVRGWMVTMTSHDLIPHWEAAYERVDRMCFAPVTAMVEGMTCRMRGDGPSSWTIYVIVARPRSKSFASWGTLPGGYRGPRQAGATGGRGKPSWLCNALVRDYSRNGDVIVDPLAGFGTTLHAAVANGRTAVGCDMDRGAYDEAVRRLRGGIQSDLFAAIDGAA